MPRLRGARAAAEPAARHAPHAAPSAPRPAPVRLPVRAAQPTPPIGTALPITRAMLGALFDATLDAVIIMDEQGLVTAWNSQAERLFGWTQTEAVGQPLATLIIPRRLRARHEAGLRQVVATGSGTRLDQRLELPALRRDGTEFPAELTITVVRNGNRTAFAGFLRDITRERSAELARSRAEGELAAARNERAAIAATLQALRARATPEETAVDIAAAIEKIRSVEFVAIYSYELDGRVIPLAVRSPAGVPITVSRPIPPERARYLRESSTGPWVDDWMPRATDDDYRRAWLEAGLTAAAYVPFGPREEPYGLISAGVASRQGRETMTSILAAVSEFAPVTGALLGPELVRRRAHADTRDGVARALETRAFYPVFQPIVELESRAVIGYEALTRFDDGTPPDRRFTEAERVGMSRELELAAMDAALAAADALPIDRWVSLNLSPERDPRRPGPGSGARRRRAAPRGRGDRALGDRRLCRGARRPGALRRGRQPRRRRRGSRLREPAPHHRAATAVREARHAARAWRRGGHRAPGAHRGDGLLRRAGRLHTRGGGDRDGGRAPHAAPPGRQLRAGIPPRPTAPHRSCLSGRHGPGKGLAGSGVRHPTQERAAMAMTFSVGARRDATLRPSDAQARDAGRRRRAFVVDDDPTTQLLLGDLAAELGWQTERFATLSALRRALARDEPDLLIVDDALPDGSGGDFIAEMRGQDRLRRLPVVICTGAVPARRRFLGRLAPVLAKPFDLFAFERIVLDVTGTAGG